MGEKIEAGRVAAWPGEADDEAKFDRIITDAGVKNVELYPETVARSPVDPRPPA
jgi:hypothetical protein